MSSSASSTPRAGGGGSGGSQHTPPLPPAPHGNGHGGGGGGGGGAHVRLMCSFGGRILPRPGDHQLRYVGGETRIVSVPRAATFGRPRRGAGQGRPRALPGGRAIPGAQWFVDALNAPAPAPIERGRSEASSIISEVPDYLFGLDTTSDEPSPGPGGARPKVDTEMAHVEDDAPVLSRGTPPAPYVTESAPWPAPPPPYMTQQVYYVPLRPVHYLDPSSQGGYMPGPVYHIVGGGGSEARGDLYSTGGSVSAAAGVGGVYGVPHPMQPFPPMMYGHAPPPGAVVYSSEGKPPMEGGAHAS
ncbi:hypothetical protein OsI_26451 [Oryza sativa Indica Group]|uniref:Uncharacterized protein n=1 Tax=Oryza sativa subsp. indica TaxID=39946 RepID=A2YMJ9_ORYSI|nr:hypothetical protein OsI_26451 [Oryza sativa Indica Group]